MKSKDRKTLYIIFSALILSVISLTTAYAALSVSLNITGQAEVQSAKWDIHFENTRVKYGSVLATKKPTIETPTTIDFTVTLNKPGDFFEFSVDIVNKGTIDAMINGINKTPTLTKEQEKYLKYEIIYSNNETINTAQILKTNQSKNIKVLVEYKKDITVSDIPKNNEEIKLGFILNYVQSNISSDSESNTQKLVRMTKGDISNPQKGDMFCIKDECFHVIKSDSSTITGIAQYNLYVGGEYRSDGIWYPYGEEQTNLQRSDMFGWVKNETPNKGVIEFSDSKTHGTYLSSYEGSLAKVYVDNYKVLLEKLGIKLNEVRLINREELASLDCYSNNYSCGETNTWIYSTSYWTGISSGSNTIYVVFSDGYYDTGYNVMSSHGRGVRPVITINKAYFK